VTAKSFPKHPGSVNVDLLQRTLDYIEEHPEEWDQYLWGHKTPCGTTFCFAGHAALLSGYKPVWRGECFAYVKTAKGKEPMSLVAWNLLGLNERYQTDTTLFYGGNSIYRLKRRVEAIIRRAQRESAQGQDK
jgi:hypothetical protein